MLIPWPKRQFAPIQWLDERVCTAKGSLDVTVNETEDLRTSTERQNRFDVTMERAILVMDARQ